MKHSKKTKREKKPKTSELEKQEKSAKPKHERGKGVKEKREEKKEEKKEPQKPRFRPHVKIVPRSYTKWVEEHLYFSGSKKGAGPFAYTVIIISLAVSIVTGLIFRKYMLFVSPAVFIVVFGILNALLILSVDRRARFVDEILPDALLLLSANIRAGYIPSRALVLSARKEFGPLADAIKRAGKEIMSGKSLDEGLREIPRQIKSEDLKRTIDLIIQGIRGGGRIVALLEENATDIRRRQAIKKEIKANTMMYTIFIAFAGCLGAPGLYALSMYLTSTTAKLTPDISAAGAISDKTSFIQLQGVQISEQFLFNFSLAAILITTIFGGLILGLISTGREKEGLKYAPILTIIAILVFFGATFIIRTMFAAILPG